MSEVLAIIPARSGSKGVPRKNFRELVGMAPLWRAVVCAWQSGVGRVVISSDAPEPPECNGTEGRDNLWLQAGPPLHTDTCAMIDVIKDVLARVPGPPEQIIVLIQPTQPLRKPVHVQQAIALMQRLGRDAVTSVVSVVELPRTHHPRVQATLEQVTEHQPGYLSQDWVHGPATRQALEPRYIRDGTVYAFWRWTVTRWDNIYGPTVRPLIIAPEETCPLDTEADWCEAERRLRDREGVPQ